MRSKKPQMPKPKSRKTAGKTPSKAKSAPKSQKIRKKAPETPVQGQYDAAAQSRQHETGPSAAPPPEFALLDPKVKLEMAKRVLARRSLIQFTKRFYPQYTPGWVHHDIARRLEQFMRDVEEKKSPRLMLLVPPRHGKSELASIRFPAFVLGHHPEWEVINCGYNLDLPMKFSRKVREIVRDPGYKPLYPNSQLDPDSQSAEAWNTTAGGGFTAAGVGGGITGKGATILIIDDPIKNQEEADSILVRDGLWDWYWSTAYSRLAPGGGILVIQTWWHDDDLAGRLQQKMRAEEESDKFVIIKYPALSEAWEYHNLETDLIERYQEPLDAGHEALRVAQRATGTSEPSAISEVYRLLRMPGEALHPERYNEKMMISMKANQPPRIWSALYQQNPVPDEGVYFKKDYFRYEPTPPAAYNRNVFQAWDFAIGEKQVNDFTVGVTLVQDEHDFLHLVEVIRFKGDSFTIVEEILNAAERWGSEPTAPLVLGVEDSQIWKAIKPLLEKRMAERAIYPPYEVLKPLTDKLARARSLQGRMQQGRVYFPQNASWLNDVQTELLRFPAGAHDDVVDALAWAVNLCVGRSPKLMPKPKELPSWKDKINSLIDLQGRGGGHMAA
jgi:predicted phage terminase large subunit-like protein